MSKKDKEKAATAIAAGRVTIGAAAYLAPNLSGRLFGLDPDGQPAGLLPRAAVRSA